MAGNYGKLIFQSADKAKAAITDAAKKDIAKLYTDWADEIGEKAKYYKTKTNASSWLQEQNMRQLQAQLTATSKQISNEVYGIAKDSIYKVSDAVVQANNQWLVGLGFPVDGVNSAFIGVPDQTVRKLITGQIYESGWSLSKSIWSDNEKTLHDIYGIVAKGLAENQTAYDISKLLENYVSPSRAKQWNLIMPDGVKIYKKSVDYNAQRLVRTLVQHGYQQSFIETTQKNPFVEYYIWRANGSRTCELCASRDGEHYAKDELPMDHPNGMCTMEPYVDEQKMIDRLAEWVNNPDGYSEDIDAFASEFGYEAMPVKNVTDYISKYGNSKLSPVAYWNNVTPYQKMEAEMLKNQAGATSWDKWYIKNIYNGNGDNLGKLKAWAGYGSKTVTSTSTKVAFDRDEWNIMLKGNNLKKMNNWTSNFVNDISFAELDGIQVYTGSAYYDMNRYLRDTSGLAKINPDYKKAIKNATSGLEKANLPETVIVRRGSGYNMLNELGVDLQDKTKIIGSILTDHGFTSTSPDPYGGFSDSIEYVIKVPKGSEAMYVDSISRHSGELELLINRGGLYQIEDYDITESGRVRKVYMTLLGNSKKKI